jgi:hypothetical protein
MDGDSMDTVSEATQRLQEAGYTINWYASDDVMLRGDQNDEVVDPAAVEIDHVLRFEGQSDPGDEIIVLALRSPSGAKGIYSPAYGPHMSTEDARVFAALRHRTGDGTVDGSSTGAPGERRDD